MRSHDVGRQLAASNGVNKVYRNDLLFVDSLTLKRLRRSNTRRRAIIREFPAREMSAVP